MFQKSLYTIDINAFYVAVSILLQHLEQLAI